MEHFSKELARFTVGKASVQFPNDQPLPKALIVKIIKLKKRTSEGAAQQRHAADGASRRR
ncbi:MAG: hypothetical protein ACRD0K_30965 [Egibacteraceae bacterium]